MAIFGNLDVVREQTKGWAGFAAAFAYLDEVFRPGSAAHARLMGLKPGETHRHDLAGGMFGLEQVYESRERYGVFESHRRLIDIQVIVTGEEIMEVAGIPRLTVTQPYDEARDVIFYGDSAAASVLRFAAGEAGVFAPQDGHMPGVRAGGAGELVRKVVVKVPV